MDKKKIVDYSKGILSKSPYLTLFMLFFTLFMLNAIFSGIAFEYKVFTIFLFIGSLGFYLTGKIKEIIWYFIALIIILIISSLVSIELEVISPGITGINFPATLFVFFFSSFLMENQTYINKSLAKTLTSFLLTLFDVVIVVILFSTLPNINQYFSLVIPIIISFLLGITIFFFKKLK